MNKPAAEYLDLLDSSTEELLDQSPPQAHPHSLAAAIRVSTDRLTRVDPAALALVRIGAFLAPEPISVATAWPGWGTASSCTGSPVGDPASFGVEVWDPGGPVRARRRPPVECLAVVILGGGGRIMQNNNAVRAAQMQRHAAHIASSRTSKCGAVF